MKASKWASEALVAPARAGSREARGAAALCFLALTAACSSTALEPTRTPVRTPQAPTVPASLTTCNVLGEVQGRQRCRIYDTTAQAFSDTGTGSATSATTPDALARRVFLFERWLDLYVAPEKQVVVRNMTEAMADTDPESRFGDEKYLGFWDDHGDSAGFGEPGQIAALYRYAVTGTEADYQRFEAWIRGAVRQFDATGMDGYLARFHYAGVPAGTPMKNALAMNPLDADGGNRFDIPQAALARMPAYYTNGIDTGGKHVTATPSWEGHTSIDAYSGPMHAWPLAYDLVRDPALKARMALHYGCFLKRLRPFRIFNLAKNADLQAAVSKYLQSGVVSFDADDPDLTKADEVWGFYLPQYNHLSAATYPTACPAALQNEPLEQDSIDVTAPGYTSKLVLFFLRMDENSDHKDGMDFAYVAGLRAGDAVMLSSYALGAYHLTKDPAFLTWREQVVHGKAHADQVIRTTGAFKLPKACRVYYRNANVYTAHLMRTLLDNDPASRAFAQDMWKRKFAGKEELGLGDSLFAVMYSAGMGAAQPELAGAIPELLSFGGTAAHLDSPRRNYSTDLAQSTPPGVTYAKAPKSEQDLCKTPISILGLTIPTPAPDPNVLYCDTPPPVMQRPPDNWVWEKDPFEVAHTPGDAGHQQYPGLDLSEPYWLARYMGYLPDSHLVLAWGPQ